MRGRKPSVWMLAALVCVLAIGAEAEVAGATTICVPKFTSACPEGGGNVAKTDLEEAMGFQGKDGQADEVRIAAGTFADGGPFEPAGGSTTSYEPQGSDALTIVGAGPGATTLTSTGTTNSFVVVLSLNNTRAVTIRDLTIQIPASFPDPPSGGGAAILYDDTSVLDNVDIVSLNIEADGVVAGGSGGVFRNGEVRAGGSGSVDAGIESANTNVSLVAEDSIVRGASWPLYAGGAGASLTARRVSVLGARTYGAVDTGGTMKLENSVFTIDDGIGLYVGPGVNDATLEADHLTIVNTGGDDPALEGKKFSGSAGDGSLLLTNSILRGFGSGYRTETPFGPGIGTIALSARYSNLSQGGSTTGGNADFTTGNIDTDPHLAADFSLPPGSPSVDAGDPAAGGLATDFLAAPRPTDGNGDGVARRDQGAFEYQPPAARRSAEEPDVTAPQTTIRKGPGAKLGKGIAKFAFKSSETPARFACKLDRGKAGGCKSPRRYTRLKPGRHVFRVWAIDRAGNKDPSAAKRRFLVPR